MNSSFLRALLPAAVTLMALHSTVQSAPLTYDIPKMDNVTIDGRADDWGEQGLRIDALANTDGPMLDPKAFDATVRLGWNGRGLLVLVNVVDPVITEADNINLLYQKDSVELFMSPFRRSWDIAQAAIAPGLDPNHRTLRLLLDDHRISPDIAGSPLTVDVKSSRTDTGYTIEALLPWTNLGLSPKEGMQVCFQVQVNHASDGRHSQLAWYPEGGAFSNSALMNILKLSKESGQPVEAAATGSYTDLRHTQIQVTAPVDLAGQSVTASDEGLTLAQGRLQESGGRADATLNFPAPSPGKSYGPLTIALNGRPFTQIVLPDYINLRQQTLLQQSLRPASSLFSGETLPSVDFADPAALRDVFGPYTIKTTYYDNQYNVVTSAVHPGRYGAIVDVTTDWGDHLQQRFSLYRTNGESDPGTQSDKDADSRWWTGLRSRLNDDPIYPYLLHLPRGYNSHSKRRWPLLVFLHGSGDGSRDPDYITTQGPNMIIAQGKDLPFIIVSPRLLSGFGWPSSLVAVFLDKIEAKYPVDPDRVYITGLSMGGMGTWNFAAAYPDRVAAVVPVSGFGDPGAMARLGRLPVWAFHGDEDTVVPIERDEATVDALKQAGGDITFTIIPHANHAETWAPTFSNPTLYKWLLSHKTSDRK